MHCGPPNKNLGWAMAHPDGPPGLPCSSPMGSGERCKRSPDHSRIFAVLYSRKTRLVAAFWFFGQHCNEWRNKSQSRLRSNLVSAGNLRHMNIIVVQTSKLIFVGSKIAAPLNFAALLGRTHRTCLRPALHTDKCLGHHSILIRPWIKVREIVVCTWCITAVAIVRK